MIGTQRANLIYGPETLSPFPLPRSYRFIYKEVKENVKSKTDNADRPVKKHRDHAVHQFQRS